MSGIVLTRPQSSGIPGTVVTGIIIPASPPSAPGSNIVIVDSCLTSNNASVKWIYTLFSASKDKVFSAEVLALHRSGANPTHSRYAMIGDRNALPHKVEVVTSGSNLNFRITNLSGNFANPADRIDYHVNVVRIQLLS